MAPADIGIVRLGRPGRRAAIVAMVTAFAGVAVAGCGGGSRPTAEEVLRRDPVALATHYGEAAAICDMAHQMIAVDWQGGWTAYPSQVTESFLRRQHERHARVALARCRRDVGPGSRVTATLVSKAGARAVVAVRTAAPSGRSVTVRMQFVDDGFGTDSPDRWLRTR